MMVGDLTGVLTLSKRHSPLSQISTDNVDELGLAWSIELGADRGIEVTPIVHNGTMFITSTWNIVFGVRCCYW